MINKDTINFQETNIFKDTDGLLALVKTRINGDTNGLEQIFEKKISNDQTDNEWLDSLKMIESEHDYLKSNIENSNMNEYDRIELEAPISSKFF